MVKNQKTLEMIEQKVHLHALLEYASSIQSVPTMVKFRILEEFSGFVAFNLILECYETYKEVINSAKIGACPACDCDPCDCHGWN